MPFYYPSHVRGRNPEPTFMARWHALWLKPDLAADTEREVNIERLWNMSRQQGNSAAAHIVNAAILAAAAWGAAPTAPLVAMTALIEAVALLQLWAWWRHRARRRPLSVSDRTL